MGPQGAIGYQPKRGLTHRDYDMLLLAWLEQRNDYGYSLTRRLLDFTELFALDENTTTTGSRVYKALTRLEGRGAISSQTPRASRALRSPRTIYSITKAGRQMLIAFVAEPISGEPTRLEVLLRLACATATDVPSLDAILARWELDCLHRLEQLGPPTAPDPSNLGSITVSFATDLSRHLLDAQLNWLADARERLRDLTAASLR